MSRKSDSVRRPPLSVSLWAQHFGEMPTRKGKENGPDFYQAIKSAMSSECPVPPLSCCCCRLSQKSKERPIVSDIEPEPNKQPPTQSHNKQPTIHPPMQGKHFNTLTSPLPWAPSCTPCIIDGNFKTCLKNFTHLPDLQFVCFVLLCVRLTLILMDQTYGEATERDPIPIPCSLPGTGVNVLII